MQPRFQFDIHATDGAARSALERLAKLMMHDDPEQRLSFSDALKWLDVAIPPRPAGPDRPFGASRTSLTARPRALRAIYES